MNKCPVTGIAYHFEIKILFMGLFLPHPLVGKGGGDWREVSLVKDFALFYIYICPSKIIYSLYSYINY